MMENALGFEENQMLRDLTASEYAPSSLTLKPIE